MYIVGVDEAGYGPNLGPLVVAATRWWVPDEWVEQDFERHLATVFRPSIWRQGCPHVPLGDSKRLYQPASGLASLETGLLAMVTASSEPCGSFIDLLQRLISNQCLNEICQLPWYHGLEQLELAIAPPGNPEILRLAKIAQHELQRLGVRLVELQAEVVTEPRFNQCVDQLGSKGELLSQVTLQVVAEQLKKCDAQTIVFCDRQGGRKNYLPVLLQALPDAWFLELSIDRARSSYMSNSGRPLTIHFSVGGDHFPPTGLASMLAKYLRERLMGQLNAFWTSHLPGLKATAGYPQDAKRFRSRIEPVAQALSLDVSCWWRSR
jgi:ribonuclease HII